MDNKQQILINKIESIRACEAVGFKEGVKIITSFATGLGCIVLKTDEKGWEIKIGDFKIIIFQPYPDIDRIYYEY